MTTAANGSIHGDQCKVYYSATLGGLGSLTEIPQVIDSSKNTERRSAESNCRGDKEVSEHVGKPKHSMQLNLLAKRGTRELRIWHSARQLMRRVLRLRCTSHSARATSPTSATTSLKCRA